MIPSVAPGQRFSLGVGVGGFEGQAALALGGSARVNNNIAIKFGASIPTGGGGSTYGGGVSFGW